MKIFSFWRSLATYRVRIALNLKGFISDGIIEVNLMKGQQRAGRISRNESDDGDPGAGRWRRAGFVPVAGDH